MCGEVWPEEAKCCPEFSATSKPPHATESQLISSRCHNQRATLARQVVHQKLGPSFAARKLYGHPRKRGKKERGRVLDLIQCVAFKKACRVFWRTGHRAWPQEWFRACIGRDVSSLACRAANTKGNRDKVTCENRGARAKGAGGPQTRLAPCPSWTVSLPARHIHRGLLASQTTALSLGTAVFKVMAHYSRSM